MTRKRRTTSILIGSVLTLGLLYSVHKGMALTLMDLTDYIGNKTNTNVVEIIDFLNCIYYL